MKGLIITVAFAVLVSISVAQDSKYAEEEGKSSVGPAEVKLGYWPPPQYPFLGMHPMMYHPMMHPMMAMMHAFNPAAISHALSGGQPGFANAARSPGMMPQAWGAHPMWSMYNNAYANMNNNNAGAQEGEAAPPAEEAPMQMMSEGDSENEMPMPEQPMGEGAADLLVQTKSFPGGFAPGAGAGGAVMSHPSMYPQPQYGGMPGLTTGMFNAPEAREGVHPLLGGTLNPFTHGFGMPLHPYPFPMDAGLPNAAGHPRPFTMTGQYYPGMSGAPYLPGMQPGLGMYPTYHPGSGAGGNAQASSVESSPEE